mmetsp:Transcript_67628/g.220142  ORF Transcript_67628/g.220142 Transcript_67628/m.220142 type:complete len:297 (+) Transcript_67628:616-1506(+)
MSWASSGSAAALATASQPSFWRPSRPLHLRIVSPRAAARPRRPSSSARRSLLSARASQGWPRACAGLSRACAETCSMPPMSSRMSSGRACQFLFSTSKLPSATSLTTSASSASVPPGCAFSAAWKGLRPTAKPYRTTPALHMSLLPTGCPREVPSEPAAGVRNTWSRCRSQESSPEAGAAATTAPLRSPKRPPIGTALPGAARAAAWWWMPREVSWACSAAFAYSWRSFECNSSMLCCKSLSTGVSSAAAYSSDESQAPFGVEAAGEKEFAESEDMGACVEAAGDLVRGSGDIIIF